MEYEETVIKSISRIIYSCKRFLNKEIALEDLISYIYENNKFITIEILKDRINDYIDFFEDIRSWYFDYYTSKDLTDKVSFEEKYNKTYKEVSKLCNFIVDFCRKEKIILFIKENDGLILYGPYTSYSIYIDQDRDTKEYTIYLWKKDIENSSIEFKIKNKEELQKFFEDNDILVEWEEKI